MGTFSAPHWSITFFAIALLVVQCWFVFCILKKAGYPGGWAVVTLVPIVGLVMLWAFAFGKWPSERKNPASKSFSMTAVSQSALAKSDEELWATVLTEFEGSARRPGLWARIYAEANGDEATAKAAYLRHRAAELVAERNAKPAQAAAQTRAVQPFEKAELAFKLVPAAIILVIVIGLIVNHGRIDSPSKASAPSTQWLDQYPVVADSPEPQESSSKAAPAQSLNESVTPNIFDQFDQPSTRSDGFDIKGAQKAGYSKREIINHLAKQYQVPEREIALALERGYSEDELLVMVKPGVKFPKR